MRLLLRRTLFAFSLALFTLAVAGVPDAQAQTPPNDDLADAVDITSLPFSDTGSNVDATTETDEADPSNTCVTRNDAGNSVWWTYTASEDGILTVTTEGSNFNNNVTVWTGSDHPLTEEACDRTTDYSNYSATATLAVEDGTTYYMRVAGQNSFSGDPVEGDISLSVTREDPIPHDDLADAIAIGSVPYSTTSSNFGATLETDEASISCNSNHVNSVWWAYTPSEDGVVTIDTDGSDFFHALSLWTGSDHPLTEEDCYYDGSDSAEISYPVTAGETYYIRISGASDTYDEGNISLSVDLVPPPDNDDLADATSIAALPYNDTATNVGATGETDELSSDCSSSSGATNSVWWEYTSSEGGVVTIDTEGSDFDRVLSLWTGSDHPLTEVDCTDDNPEQIQRNVSAGETLYIRISGYSDSGEGDIELSVTIDAPLPNDDLADATDISALPFSDTGSNVGATVETGEEIASCGAEDDRESSVWWKYTASEEGKLTIDTGGSDFDLVLSAWTGSDHPLTQVGCTDSDSGGDLDIIAGETYYIRISGYDEDDAGDISLSASFSLPDPVYLDASATGNNDGSSWTDAYTDLHDALNDGGSEIWIAEGTYGNGGTSFDLTSRVRLYGGFAGTETKRSERDPAQHEVTLTGTANHVVYAKNVGGGTVLDGLTISGGHASGSGDGENGGGLYCDGNGSTNFCSPTLRNILFENNTADEAGGAIYADGSNGGSTSLTLIDVAFLNNDAQFGGALYIDANSQGGAYLELENVVFADNSASQGGAVYSRAQMEGTASPEFINVLFANNSAISAGGAMHNTQAGGFGGWATPRFTNVTFYGNSADTGPAIYNYKTGGGESKVRLENVIAWNNVDGYGNTGDGFTDDGMSPTTIAEDAIIEGGCPDFATCTRVVDENPSFQASSNPDGPDDTYGTDDDGLRLASGSPAIDAGNQLGAATHDLAGNPRVFGGAVDLGPYEYHGYQSESDEPDVKGQTGFFKLGSTGATVFFSENSSSSGGLSASRTDEAPSGSGLPDNLAARYWTITDDLDGAFTYNVTFDLTGVDGIDDFSALKVFKSDDDGQTWAAVDSLIHDEDNQTITAANLTSFFRFAVGDNTNALPVELMAFEATQSDEAVRLSWKTASETDNAGFAVERRLDEAAFAEVGFVEGHGTTTEAQTYRYTDADLPYEAKRVAYRLKQVDADGTAEYSPEVEIDLTAPERFVLHGNYPNPFRGQTTIRYELPQASEVQVAVYDALGRRVAVLADGRQEAGRKALAFEARGLSSGVYFVRLQAGGHVATRKITVVR